MHMKAILNFICTFLVGGLLSSCDYVDREVVANYGKEKTVPTDTTANGDTSEVRMRKFLIEDFTGHRCPNCPSAANEIKLIEELYGEKVVAMAIHVTNQFAGPNTAFPAEYRTTEGTEIDAFFGVSASGLPKGMINRIGYPNAIISDDDWRTQMSNIINTPIDAWIGMKNTYNESLNKVTCDLKIDFENNINDDIKICVFLVQDSIISPQTDGGTVIPNYVHMHMLRKALTPAFGEALTSNPTSATPEISKSYSIVLSSDNIPEQCKIVAYIYKASNYEIIQVQEKHVK